VKRSVSVISNDAREWIEPFLFCFDTVAVDLTGRAWDLAISRKLFHLPGLFEGLRAHTNQVSRYEQPPHLTDLLNSLPPTVGKSKTNHPLESQRMTENEASVAHRIY
jgi:hypothetical protein